MMTAKMSCALLGLLAWVVVGQEADAPVPVEKEPLHHLVLKNDAVVVLHLTLPAGERTLYHTHIHDRVAVDLSSTAITQQNWKEEEGPVLTREPGNISVFTQEGSGLTHRVHTVGKQAFDVLDVELLKRPETGSTAVAAEVAGENPSARVYKWALAPGATSAMHTHVRPYLVVAATVFMLEMTGEDGKSSRHEVKAGDFHWVEGKVTHSLGNAGSGVGKIVEIELK